MSEQSEIAMEGAQVSHNEPTRSWLRHGSWGSCAGDKDWHKRLLMLKSIQGLRREFQPRITLITPGVATNDFRGVDDLTGVFVPDPTFGNVISFNVGASVD